MKMKVTEREPRLEVNLVFDDSRVLDLDIALHFACEENSWQLESKVWTHEQTVYDVVDRGTFLARVSFSHGMEPPTRATFDNRPSDEENFRAAAKQSTREVVQAFLIEGANRLLITDKAKEKALRELSLVSISN